MPLFAYILSIYLLCVAMTVDISYAAQNGIRGAVPANPSLSSSTEKDKAEVEKNKDSKDSLPSEVNLDANDDLSQESSQSKDNLWKQGTAAYMLKKYARAQELWLMLAKQGDGRAMNNLGVLYERGEGTKVNPVEAVSWFRKSAEAGHVDGMNNYARMLEQGLGVTRNIHEALDWFYRAAKKGQADAQYNLGFLYEKGQGVTKDFKKAASWYSQAATTNHAQAQARLGHLYHEGLGVDVNMPRATLLLYGAAMLGNEQAMQELIEIAEKENKKIPNVTLFGITLNNEKAPTRSVMRKALANAKIKSIREDMAYICDIYDVRTSVPGATEMAACYGMDSAQELGFLKIDYAAPNKERAKAVEKMVTDRFGKPSAGKGDAGMLWNLGLVMVATQYVPDVKQVGLMYMLPKVYYKAQQP